MRKNLGEQHQLLAWIRAEIETTAPTESGLEAMTQADRVKLEPSSELLRPKLRKPRNQKTTV
jgi:hypothetical protein